MFPLGGCLLLSCPALFLGFRCRCVVLPALGGMTGCTELTRKDSRRHVCDKAAVNKARVALVFSGAWHVGGH